MKKLIIKDIKIPLSAGKTVSELDKAATEEARKRVKMTGSCDLTVYKRSLDMRKRSEPMYVYSVSASVPDGAMLSHIKGAELSDDDDVKVVPKGKKRIAPSFRIRICSRCVRARRQYRAKSECR